MEWSEVSDSYLHTHPFTIHPSPFTPSLPSISVQLTVRFRTLFLAGFSFLLMYKGFAELAYPLCQLPC